MKTKLIPIILVLMSLTIPSLNAQCYSNKGIMNEACASMTIVMPPAFDVSLGFSSTNLLKVDVNYITKDEIVYGGAVGIRPRKVINSDPPADASINVFLGYNLAGCAIIGCTAGFTHLTKYGVTQDPQIKTTSMQSSIGMSIKFISVYTKIPITFGAYGSNAGIGVTIGTIF